jgi:DNA polymerase
MTGSEGVSARAIAGALSASLARQAELGNRAPDASLLSRIEGAVEAMVASAAEGAVTDRNDDVRDPVVRGRSGTDVGSAQQAIASARAVTSSPASSAPAGRAAPSKSPPATGSGDTADRKRPIWAPEPKTCSPTGIGTAALDTIWSEVDGCTRCALHERRTNIVFGDGNPDARLMFIGEGPGGQEDREGTPFVGPAGQLLNRMIGAMGLARTDVYIANIVKCRPPGNRDPRPEEVSECIGFLERQVAAVKPEVIVTLGRVAPEALFGRTVAITRERGTWTTYANVPVMMTYHPAFLLRQPAAKRDAWADLQSVMERLGLKAQR